MGLATSLTATGTITACISASRGRAGHRDITYAAIEPHPQQGGYVNFTSGDGGGKAGTNYGRSYARLREVKRVYDPGNLFHLNQNIAP